MPWPGRALFALCGPDPSLARALEELGVDVAIAPTPSELARVRRGEPAWVLLDLDVPGAADIAAGFAQGPARSEHVALFASAASVFSGMKCLAARRADHVLLKPVSAEELLSIIAAAGTGEARPRLPSLERIQWEYVQAVLGSCNGNISEAARQLGIYRQSLQRMLRRHPPSR